MDSSMSREERKDWRFIKTEKSMQVVVKESSLVLLVLGDLLSFDY
jgi:hypothetical protein